MDNMKIYNAVREVPKEAQKTISGGRLNGKTDINPMWRIKALTEQFGPCGIGWKYQIVDKRIVANNRNEPTEAAAFVDIDLYVKVDGEWSAPIPGTGGSMFIARENKGLYMSDECFKMALTDAISVACKALGVGADIYWQKDSTKYDKPAKTIKALSYEEALEYVPNGQDKPLKELWKQGVATVKKIAEGDDQAKQAADVIAQELRKKKAAKSEGKQAPADV